MGPSIPPLWAVVVFLSVHLFGGPGPIHITTPMREQLVLTRQADGVWSLAEGEVVRGQFTVQATRVDARQDEVATGFDMADLLGVGPETDWAVAEKFDWKGTPIRVQRAEGGVVHLHLHFGGEQAKPRTFTVRSPGAAPAPL